MRIYIMLPFGTIEPIWSADEYSGDLIGNLTHDYVYFFEAPYKYKFKKAPIDSDNYKDANLKYAPTESWTYTIIDPETFSSY